MVARTSRVLTEHLARVERDDSERCFGSTGETPFDGQKLQARADKAWREAGLERITPHECRHTFASLMIAARVNAKALQAFMGHSSITTTLDTYGHLMPGSEDEAATLLDAYLDAQGSEPKRRLGRLVGSSPMCSLAHRLAHQWRTTAENRLLMRYWASSLPILKILVPQSGHVPWIAGRPFFIVTCWGSLISTFFRSFTQ